jgi:hypothetical protein
MDLFLWFALSLDSPDRGSAYESHREGVRTVMRMGIMGAGKGGTLAPVRALQLLECMYMYNLTDTLLVSGFNAPIV